MLPDKLPKLEGNARVLAFPLALHGSIGQTEWAIDEGPCWVSLDRGGQLWHVQASGVELVLPVSACAIFWDVEEPALVAEALEVEQKKAGQKEEQQVFKCSYCSAPYLIRIDAEVCARLDDPKLPPFPPDSDCRKCGYPLPLHASSDLAGLVGGIEPNACTLLMRDGSLETAKHEVRFASSARSALESSKLVEELLAKKP